MQIDIRLCQNTLKKGVPDIILVFKGQFIGLEVKRQGGKQSEYQLEFEKEVKENGGKYHVVSSINDVINLGF
jgi:VRR-NUC domain.